MHPKEIKLEHILYEIQMYQQTLLLIIFKLNEIDSNSNGYGTIIKNTIFESHKLHLRNLLLFFNSNKLYEDDIVYSDIITADNSIYDLNQEYIKLRDLFNKTTMHLSNKRVELDIIERDNDDVFKYCFFSTTVPSSFIGMGEVINNFLKELDSQNGTPSDIVTELGFANIIHLKEGIQSENYLLLSYKDVYDISIDTSNKITIKAIKTEVKNITFSLYK